jgi:hypothetical protein
VEIAENEYRKPSREFLHQLFFGKVYYDF